MSLEYQPEHGKGDFVPSMEEYSEKHLDGLTCGRYVIIEIVIYLWRTMRPGLPKGPKIEYDTSNYRRIPNDVDKEAIIEQEKNALNRLDSALDRVPLPKNEKDIFKRFLKRAMYDDKGAYRSVSSEPFTGEEDIDKNSYSWVFRTFALCFGFGVPESSWGQRQGVICDIDLQRKTSRFLEKHVWPEFLTIHFAAMTAGLNAERRALDRTSGS
jgi:hypothetical protein